MKKNSMFELRAEVRLALLVGASTVGLASAAAQVAPIEEDATAASPIEIVVTAQKRAESVQDIPISISAFGEEQISQRGIDSLERVASQVPALNFGEAAGLALISVRGAGFSVITGAGDNAVAVHRDGVYIVSTRAAAMFQDDLERVEVLKGPQGTLYGRNATAGVLNLISRGAPDAFEGEFKLGYGNYDAKSVSGTAGGPLSDGLRVRLSGSYLNRDGHILDLNNNRRLGGVERYAVSAAIDGDFSESVSTQLRLFQSQEDFAGPIYDPIDRTSAVLPAGTFDLHPYRVRWNAGPVNAVRRLKGGSLAVNFEVAPDISIKSLTGYNRFRYEATYDADGTGVNGFLIDPIATLDRTFSQELNLVGDGPSVKYVAGLYYSNIRRQADTLTIAPGFNVVGIDRITNQYDATIKNYAGFVDVAYLFSPRFRAYGGIRYLRETAKTFQDSRQILTSGVTTAGCPIKMFDDDDNNLSGRAGLQFDPTSNIMIYGQYSTGYKSGGRSPSSCDNYFKPEKLSSFELGFKSRLLDGDMTFNAAAFHYTYDGNQIEQITGISNYIVQNADAKLYGFEAEARLHATDRLSLDLGLNLLHSEYVDFVNQDRLNAAAGRINLDGRPMIRAPKFKMNAGVQFEQPLGAGSSLTFRADMYATSKYQLREFDPVLDAQKGYVTGDASLTYRFSDERLSIKAWVRNIANEAILGGLVANGAIPGQTTGPWRSGAYQMPRTYGVEIGAKF